MVFWGSRMRTRDIIIGAVVLVVLISGVLIIRKARNKAVAVPTSTPTIAERVQKSFNGLVIPSDRENVDLSDVTGGEGIGVASRKYSGGTFSLTIMADLPEPKSGYFYQGWIIRGSIGDNDFSYVSVGPLRLAKGGYITDFSSAKDYSDYKKVVVTLEKGNGAIPEGHVLEGSF